MVSSLSVPPAEMAVICTKEFLGAFLVFSLTILVFSVLNLCFEFVLVNLCFEFEYLSWLPTNNGVLAGL